LPCRRLQLRSAPTAQGLTRRLREAAASNGSTQWQIKCGCGSRRRSTACEAAKRDVLRSWCRSTRARRRGRMRRP
jgi:hypothetical protein